MTDQDRSIGAVLGEIVGDPQQIVRAEVRLGKAELREELAKVGRGAKLLVAGAVALILALGLMLLSAVYALAMVWPPWAAALAVGVVTATVGYAVAVAGRKQMSSVELPPQKATAMAKESLQWAKTRAK